LPAPLGPSMVITVTAEDEFTSVSLTTVGERFTKAGKNGLATLERVGRLGDGPADDEIVTASLNCSRRGHGATLIISRAFRHTNARCYQTKIIAKRFT